jgi:urease accessory protein
VIFVESVLGSRLDPSLSHQLHELEHLGQVDTLTLPPTELARRRFRATTAAGQDVAIALPRDQPLYDGAVLLLEPRHALVVRVQGQRWLRLQPHGVSDAVALGYHAGNLHWRVRFEGDALLVALEAPVDDYLARLRPLLEGRQMTTSVMESE